MSNEWNGSFIISLVKGKEDVSERERERDRERGRERSNYHSLKPTDHALKVVERITKEIIRNVIEVDDLQF